MQLRLVSYNVHKCIGGVDRRFDPERLARVVEHHAPDVACLQEVAASMPKTEGMQQAEWLAERLGYRYWSWFENHRFRHGGHYGNAILSRWPIYRTENIDVTQGRRKKRSVVHARLRVTFKRGKRRTRTLHVFNMHLGLGERERRKQLVQFMEAHPFAGLDPRAPIVIAGDFNDVYGTLGTKLLEPAGFRRLGAPLRTFPAWAPLRALDAVYVRGDIRFQGLARSRLAAAKRASDHLPLIAELGVRR